MDSGNSGSLQSSSGGEEEYDSRAADSLFMTTHPPPHVGPISDAPPRPRPPPPPLFDPLSNYMQLHQNSNSLLLNPNISWPRPTTIRSDPNSSTSHHDTINPMLSASPLFMPSFQTPATAAGGDDNNHLGGAPAAQHQNQAAARNPKKRSRASRRAPTTVLTTDTTNFRAMVQEFTGIPAPPFSNSSFPRSRLDLFSTRSTALEAAQPPQPPYLRRPFAQKVQSPPPFLISSTSLLGSTAIAPSSTANTTISSVSSLPITQSSNLFNVQNPLLTSLLQSNPKFLFSNSSVMASKPHNFEIPSNDIMISHGNHVSPTLSGLPSLISPDQIGAQNDRNENTNDNNAESWRNNGVSPDEDDDYQGRMKRINGGFSFQRNSTTMTANGKMNYSASPSNFHGEKGPENIATRGGEGMVESWICSSD